MSATITILDNGQARVFNFPEGNKILIHPPPEEMLDINQLKVGDRVDFLLHSNPENPYSSFYSKVIKIDLIKEAKKEEEKEEEKEEKYEKFSGGKRRIKKTTKRKTKGKKKIRRSRRTV